MGMCAQPVEEDEDAEEMPATHNKITAVIGEPLEVSLRARRRWSMVANVADRLSVGRVHLIGDAAHQFPPAGGFGMNTGLQDAHNLCWKVAAVHHGVADPSLLRSYDAERRPVALTNASLSVHNCGFRVCFFRFWGQLASSLFLAVSLNSGASSPSDKLPKASMTQIVVKLSVVFLLFTSPCMAAFDQFD